MTNRNSIAAFSLVEVVVALGIMAFAGLALIGLLGVGLGNSQDSKQRLQAATIAESICSTRRSAPTADLATVQAGFPLPPLNAAQNDFATPLLVTSDGVITSAASGNARYGLIYNIMPASATTPTVSTVYLCLYWPASPTPRPNSSFFELTTTFALP